MAFITLNPEHLKELRINLVTIETDLKMNVEF